MSDFANLRFVQAARRVVSSFDIAGSAMSVGFLAWLTSKAAGEAPPKADAPDSSKDKPGATTHELPAVTTQASKSGGTTDAAATISEDGSHATTADPIAGRADPNDAQSKPATSGKANGKGPGGTVASVGSSTNPTILFADQATDATIGVSIVLAPVPDTKTPSGLGVSNDNDAGIQAPHNNNSGMPDLAVVVGNGNGNTNDNSPVISSDGGGATAAVSVAEDTTAVTSVTATDADADATLIYSIVGGADAAKFSINATTGVLEFVSAPDAEIPTDAGGNNVYDVQVQVSDGTNTDVQDIAVTVTNVNDNTPVITSNGGGATSAVNVAENGTAVTTVTATDADADATLTYSIVGGADAAKFTINASTGVLELVSAPDAEAPTDAGGNNVYDVQVQVSDGANTDTQNIAVTVNNVNDNAPVITSDGGAATAAVNVAENTTPVTTVTATDADAGATLAYSIVGGADVAKFTINAITGVLEFVSAPDAETPTDAGGNNVYDVQVQVSDGTNTDAQDVAVTVTNVNDNAPAITSNGGAATAAVNVAENGTAVTTVTATDADAGATLTYSIVGGADAAKFTINASTGVLEFVSAPDAEAPTDAGGNNVYDVQVQVSDGTNTDTQDIAVTVTNVNDNTPIITSNGGGATAAVNVAENSTAVTTVTASDADAGATLAYSIVGGADATKFTINATTGLLEFVSAPDAETPTDAGGNNVYDVQVQVSDGTNTDVQDIAVTVTNVNDNTPVVTSNGGGTTAAVNVAENSTAVTTVTASDADAGATLTYSIVGGADAAKFTINVSTGVLEFVSPPDAEAPTDAGGNNVYDVQVQVSDGTNTAVQDIAVTVTGVNDNTPVVTSNGGAATAAVNVAENSTTVTTVMATDADAGATLTYSIVGGADAAKFTINGSMGLLEFVSAPDAEAPTDAGGNNVYDVQVQVSDGTNTDTQDIAVTVTNVNDNAPVITSNGGAATAAVNVAENTTAVTTVTATDADAGATLTYSIVGGADAAKFTVNGSTGLLEFVSAPDFEIPTDAGGNNTYDVQVQVSDGTNTDIQDIAVTITNISGSYNGTTGDDTITGSSEEDTITGLGGNDTLTGGFGADTITGGAGTDVMTGGTGADTFVIGAVADLAAGETINGTAEAGTIDTLRLDAAGTYNLSGFATITNIDAVAFNVNAAGFNLTVADSQVSTADTNGDGTQNDLQIGASVAMTNGVTINASGLTGLNRITVIGTNLGGADTITGGAGVDTIDGGAGADVITGGAGADILTGGAGADTFVIGAVAHLAAGETIDGTAEAGTIDTLRLNAAGTYNLSTFTTISNIDAVAFNVNAAGFNLTVADSQVSTADANGDGTLNDLQISASLAMTNAVTINAAGLTGTNRITVVGTNLGGADAITGGAGSDTIDGGAGVDTITGGAGNDTITGGTGADVLTGGTGADTFVIGTVAALAAGETINGTAEAGTIDTMRLDAAGTYNLSTFTTISNIDAIAFNVNAAGFNLTVVDSQVSTADVNGDGTLNDLQISAALAMTNAVTINASGLTGTNRITVVGTNLGGADTITGGAGVDTIDGGAGNDTITGGAGADVLTGGTGADTFVIGVVAHLAAGETIDGTAEAGTIDTLRLNAAGTYNLSTFTTISNIDAIAFNVNTAGFNLTVVDSQVSTADANGDGTLNDIQISASLAMTNAVTINAAGLTGTNRITVVGTNLGGADTITGGAGADTIDGGAGVDAINGGTGNDTITGGTGADVLTGGTGADTFVIGTVAALAAGETINGTAEAGTIDTLRLNAAGTYNLSTFSTITNIDAIAFNVNAAGFNLTVVNSQVSTADANGNGTLDDLQISASLAMTNAVTINASGLTGTNRITVVGTNLGGGDTITGGAGVDTIDGGAGNDTITGGTGADVLTGGTGADTFVIGTVAHLAAGETINGTAEAGTIDTLRLNAAGTYNLSTFSTISNIDAIAFNVNTAGFNLTVVDSQVSTADANGDGTLNDIQISAALAMTNAVTINASGLTGTNRITVVGTNLGGADTITGGAGVDTINGGAGADVITGGAGADVLTGGTGADTFVIGAVADLAAGETINGTAEAGTLDTLRLNAAGTYNLSTFTTISNIDVIAFNVNAAGFNLTVADSQVSTADANGDGTLNDLQISASLAMTNAVTINAAGLTGTNRITVVGTNLGGADTITGGAGADTIDGGAGVDAINGGTGNDTITGGTGADVLTGGTGADTFVIGVVAHLAAGETIDGTAEAGTIDTLRLNAAGTYNLSTFTTISNIDAIAFNVNTAGFNLTVVDSQVSTADANGDGTLNDIQISASLAMTNAVTINASGLTGTNRITVVGTNLGGADTITGGAGVDTINGGAGNDTITGGAGADVLTGGTGADTFVIGVVAHLAAGETIDGTAEAGTIDTLRLNAAGTYNLSTFTTISNIDAIAFNVNTAGFNLTVVDSQVSTADANGDGTLNDIQISAALAMTNAVTISGAALTGTNRITVVGTNLGGADAITGGAGADTIDGGAGVDTITGGAGNDTITGGTGADVLTGGTGADTFVIGTVAALAAGETINGTAEAGTIDTLRLNAAGTYNLSTFTTISNIDVIAFNVNAAGFNLTVVNSQVSTADANGNGTLDDLQISASLAMTNAVTINASGLTGTNRITVVGTNLGGGDTITGGAGADTIDGGAGVDTIDGGAGADTITGGAGADALTGGTGADHFVFMATTEGTDTIADFSSAQVDLIDILVSAFGGGLTTGTDPATVFASSANSTFGSATERFHYNTATGTLLYDADGTGAGAVVTLATFTGLPALTAADLHFI